MPSAGIMHLGSTHTASSGGQQCLTQAPRYFGVIEAQRAEDVMATPGRFTCILALVAASLLGLNSLAHADGVNVNFIVDVNKVADSIVNAISGQGNTDREGFVKNLANQCWNSEGQKYNCMVFNLGQNWEWTNQQGVVLYGSAVYQGTTYGIW
ncbi:probable stress response protein YvgO at C-terminar half [Coccomyxa sp. Obi]|nr:probable stress response protein YvgO at C-terminar half [Coccomyxa sp. Obi]